jgi:hypothetical protein
MSDWLKELEDKLNRECPAPLPKKKQVVSESVPVVSKQNNDFGSVLFAFVLGLMVMLGSIWLWKGSDLFDKVAKKTSPAPPAQVQRQPWEESLRLMAADVDGLNTQCRELSEKQQTLNGRFDSHNQRLALLAALHSNNFVEARKLLPNANFIFPDREWKIGRLPDNLDMTDEDKERLGKFLRGSQEP